MKIKSSQIDKFTLSFADISKSRPCREFLTSQICVLTLFAKIKFSLKFPNLQYALMVPSLADQLLPQPLIEQCDTLPIQCRYIEHMYEGVWLRK